MYVLVSLYVCAVCMHVVCVCMCALCVHACVLFAGVLAPDFEASFGTPRTKISKNASKTSFRRCRIQKTYPKNVSKRIQTYPTVSKRIQTYPKVSKRIQKKCVSKRIQKKLTLLAETYPNVSKSAFSYPKRPAYPKPNVSKIKN